MYYNMHNGITKSAICAAVIDDETLSMAHMRAAMTKNREDDSDATPAMRWGALAHAVLLEPRVFARRLATWTGKRKAGKKWDDFEAEHAGQWIVSPGELDKLAAMRAAVQADDTARGIMARVRQTEHAVYWEDDVYGLAKGRLDGCGEGIVVEYKTVRSISRRHFQSDAKRRGYDLGAGWYWHGYGRPQNFCFLVQESVAPFSVACYEVPVTLLEDSYERAAEIATMYHICEQTGRFPGPYRGMMTFELPQWGGGEVDASNGETMEASEL